MCKKIRYAGHLYVAADSEQELEAAGYGPEDQAEAEKQAKALLEKYQVKGTVTGKIAEADGIDVIFALEGDFKGTKPTLTVDLAKKTLGGWKVNEAQLMACRQPYTAVTKDGLVGLLNAVLILQTAEAQPTPTYDKAEAEKAKNIDWLVYTVVNEWDAANVNLVDQKGFAQQMQFAIKNNGKLSENGKENVVAQNDATLALKIVNALKDEEWKQVVIDITSEQGKNYVPSNQLVIKAIGDLTKHEGTVKTVDILSFAGGNLLTMIKTQYRSVFYVFDRQAGNKLNLVDAYFPFCNATFHVGSDPKMAQSMFSGVIDLDIAYKTSAVPENSQPPGEGEDSDKLEKLLENSLVFQVDLDTREYRWKLNDQEDTISEQGYKDRWGVYEGEKTSPWVQLMKEAGVKYALRLDPTGVVYLIDTKTGDDARELGTVAL